MPQKLSVGGVKWVENTSQFSKDFTENCNEDSEEEYFLEVDGQYPEKLYDLRNYLYFITKKYVIHTRNLKQALNDGLVLRKKHGVIKFYQEAWLKPYIYMNSELRKNVRKDFKICFQVDE